MQPTVTTIEKYHAQTPSHLYWISTLTQRSPSESLEGDKSIEIENAQYSQIAKSQNCIIKENKGVVYVSYRNPAFQNCGYIRIPAHATKPKAHSGKYSVVSFTFDLTIFHISNFHFIFFFVEFLSPNDQRSS